jgi:hypothetical protein
LAEPPSPVRGGTAVVVDVREISGRPDIPRFSGARWVSIARKVLVLRSWSVLGSIDTSAVVEDGLVA